jgi:hypothetical protein
MIQIQYLGLELFFSLPCESPIAVRGRRFSLVVGCPSLPPHIASARFAASDSRRSHGFALWRRHGFANRAPTPPVLTSCAAVASSTVCRRRFGRSSSRAAARGFELPASSAAARIAIALTGASAIWMESLSFVGSIYTGVGSARLFGSAHSVALARIDCLARLNRLLWLGPLSSISSGRSAF